VGWAGDDMIFGGAGTDTVAFNGSRADFIFAKNADGSVQITDKSTGFSGPDTVWGVEFFQFDDATLSFDTLFPPPPPPPLPPPNPHDRIVGGKGNDHIHGWDGNDIIYGGNGKDYLYGDNGNDRLYGGQHKDVMYGGAGNDVFVLNTKPSKTNVDTIKDFNPTYDTIWLDNKYFKVGSKGTEAKPLKMSSKMFWTGTKAHDKDDRIIYDKKSGVLYYDADGTGSSAQVKIAVLSKNLKVNYHDFYVV
jgi:Ca2+-binding RTX toxin-like protein